MDAGIQLSYLAAAGSSAVIKRKQVLAVGESGDDMESVGEGEYEVITNPDCQQMEEALGTVHAVFNKRDRLQFANNHFR